MLKTKTLDDFINQVNHAHKQFCIWYCVQKKSAKRIDDWVKKHRRSFFTTEELSQNKEYLHTYFLDIVGTSLQHGFILSLARLFDPAYANFDKKKKNPRLSLEYILMLLDDASLAQSIDNRIKGYKSTTDAIKKHRDNFLVHNTVNFKITKINAGIEKLFEELDNAISEIKQSKTHFANCRSINLKDTEVVSRCSIDEIF